MKLRWKKNPRAKGLAGVIEGARGSTLYLNGVTRVAVVMPHNRSHVRWYWMAGWEGRELGVPHANTVGNPQTEADAKAAAMAFVKQHLKVPVALHETLR